MVIHSKGPHHFQIRKRIHQKHEPYPHPKKWKRIVDKMIYIAGFFVLAMTIPQLIKIWIEQNAAGISIITWSAYLLGAIAWLIYGIAHKEKPIIMIYSIWIILDILIITGIWIYG